jgi:hypothetical protein
VKYNRSKQTIISSYRLSIVFIIALLACGVAGASKALTAGQVLLSPLTLVRTMTVDAPAPLLITEADSTRAIALDAAAVTAEPFSARPVTPFVVSPERQTRIALYAKNIGPSFGDADASSITVDAEDYARNHYPLMVESVSEVTGYPGLYRLVVKFDETLPAMGDVLISIEAHGKRSNRARVGIGFAGAGLPDDSTPAPMGTGVATTAVSAMSLPAITGFQLHDAAGNVYAVTDGTKLTLGQLSEPLEIVAYAGNTPAASVRMKLAGIDDHVDDNQPYKTKQFRLSELGAGTWQVMATPYTNRTGKGLQGTTLTASIQVVDSTSAPTPAATELEAATLAAASSPDGTKATSITDSSGNLWTLGSNRQTLRNGIHMGAGYGSIYKWYGGIVYVFGNDSRWYRWVNSTWSMYGSSEPGGVTTPTPTPTPSGTSLDGTKATSIRDSSGNLWTLGSSRQTLRNGVHVGAGYGSIYKWYSRTVYVLGTDSRWYRWVNSSWNLYGSTEPGGTSPTPTPTPTPPPSSSATIYVAPNGSPGNSGSSSSPIDLATAVSSAGPVRPGYTVQLSAGIYRYASLTFGPAGSGPNALTVFKAAPGARVIITSPSNTPPQIRMRDYMRLEGLWLGGTKLTTDAANIQLGSSPIARWKQLVNCTIFGYYGGVQSGSAEYLLLQGNRFVHNGNGNLYHAVYISGSASWPPPAGTLTQHTIVDNNLFIAGPGDGGYGVHFYHNNRTGIATRNFVTYHWGYVMDGSDHLAANNLCWKCGARDGSHLAFTWVYAKNTRVQNNILGPLDYFMNNNDSTNVITRNAFQVSPTGTNRITLTAGQEAAQLGLSAASIDSAIATLNYAFSRSIDTIWGDVTIEPAFATLRNITIPSGSPLYRTGLPWFDSNPINVGPNSGAPGSVAAFWQAFRALGLREFDRNGNIMP